MRKTVYLAGPINGCTKGEANDWRNTASARLADFGITGISPLRCEPLVGDRYGIGHNDARFGVPSAIASKNRFDVQQCDMMLAYFPPEQYAGAGEHGDMFYWPSIGTVWEIGMAHAFGTPAIVVCENKILKPHPVIQTAPWVLDNLEEGLDVAIGVLQDYAQGSVIERNPILTIAAGDVKFDGDYIDLTA